jgi:hypothetical protein
MIPLVPSKCNNAREVTDLRSSPLRSRHADLRLTFTIPECTHGGEIWKKLILQPAMPRPNRHLGLNSYSPIEPSMWIRKIPRKRLLLDNILRLVWTINCNLGAIELHADLQGATLERISRNDGNRQ